MHYEIASQKYVGFRKKEMKTRSTKETRKLKKIVDQME